MLHKARRRLRRAGIRNTGYTQANAAGLPFRSDALDVVFMVAVLGEVSDAKACLASIAEVLQPGGLLVVAELAGDPDAVTKEHLLTLTRGTGLEFGESQRISGGTVCELRRRLRDSD
jgi:ubiquinone/menaquinone biosynthesis C-methylase UbiE